jgi:hypothetical protein
MDNQCFDIANFGNCLKGKDCDVCNIVPIVLNTAAKAYVPKSKQLVTLNLEAKEYKPKMIADPESDGEYDMIIRDIVEDEFMEEYPSDEDDDDKFYPNYEKCECCRGFIYKCKGPACLNMGVCYCKMQEECDEEGS